jgi:hypothetical protein
VREAEEAEADAASSMPVNLTVEEP